MYTFWVGFAIWVGFLFIVPSTRKLLQIEIREVRWKWREHQIQWHKKQLERLDEHYNLEQASKKLAAARDKWYEAGGSASGLDLPVLADFYEPPDLEWLKDKKPG
jgi:hypothetical protein